MKLLQCARVLILVSVRFAATKKAPGEKLRVSLPVKKPNGPLAEARSADLVIESEVILGLEHVETAMKRFVIKALARANKLRTVAQALDPVALQKRHFGSGESEFLSGGEINVVREHLLRLLEVTTRFRKMPKGSVGTSGVDEEEGSFTADTKTVRGRTEWSQKIHDSPILADLEA